MIALHNTAESYWYGVLTDTERKHYERCVTAIITYYNADIYKIRECIRLARLYGFAYGRPNSKLVRAILWRIEQELDDNDY